MNRKRIRWTMRRETDVALWVDVAKADAIWRAHECYVGPQGAGGNRFRYERFGRWLLEKPRLVVMPSVGLCEGLLLFEDGRHRFAWLRDHGLEALPFAVHPDDAEVIEGLLGSPARLSWLSLSETA